MIQKPLISVITICFNAAGVILPTLQSVAAQNAADFEYLVIDGNSTDNTLDLVRNARIPNTRVISEPDRGIYDAMNKGLRNARGQYLLFLNAGDRFDGPDTLALYEAAARRGADIVYGDTVIVDGNGTVLGPRHLSAPKRLTRKSFADGMLVCHQAFMVRRDLAPLYDTAYRFSADYDWTVKCLEGANPDRNINLDTVTIHYLADGTTDRNKLKSLRERFRIMCRHYGTVPTVLRHIRFAARAAARKFTKRK